MVIRTTYTYTQHTHTHNIHNLYHPTLTTFITQRSQPLLLNAPSHHTARRRKEWRLGVGRLQRSAQETRRQRRRKWTRNAGSSACDVPANHQLCGVAANRIMCKVITGYGLCRQDCHHLNARFLYSLQSYTHCFATRMG